MARGDRTVVEVDPLIEAIITLLQNASSGDLMGKIDEWERPKDPSDDFRYVDPPYLLVREYPSAGQMSGPISDSKSDQILRVQLLAIGRHAGEARRVRDWSRRVMQRNALEALLIDRAVMDLSLMVAGGGTTRDDDLPNSISSSTDLYELWTTPIQEGS